jgi:hypothetical protein
MFPKKKRAGGKMEEIAVYLEISCQRIAQE